MLPINLRDAYNGYCCYRQENMISFCNIFMILLSVIHIEIKFAEFWNNM